MAASFAHTIHLDDEGHVNYRSHSFHLQVRYSLSTLSTTHLHQHCRRNTRIKSTALCSFDPVIVCKLGSSSSVCVVLHVEQSVHGSIAYTSSIVCYRRAVVSQSVNKGRGQVMGSGAKTCNMAS